MEFNHKLYLKNNQKNNQKKIRSIQNKISNLNLEK